MLKNWGYRREGAIFSTRPSSFPPNLSRPLFHLLNPFLVLAGFALRLYSYEGRLILFLFQRYIFSSYQEREPSSSASRPHSPPPLSISRFDPVRSAEDNPRNLLFGISWIIINAYAVAGGIDRPVILLLFLVSLSPSPPPHHSPLLPSVASNTSVRRRTTTVAWNNSIQRFVSNQLVSS